MTATVRQAFAEAHRAARLIWNGHHIAALAAHKRLSPAALAVYPAALRTHDTGAYPFALAAAAWNASQGRSRNPSYAAFRRALAARAERRALGLPVGSYGVRPLP